MTPRLLLYPEKDCDGSYRPTYRLDGADLGARHRTVEAEVAGVPGWLRPEDVLKLYELAALTPGPILEIGCFHGKSTVVMALALRDHGNPARLVSLDVDPTALAAARRSVARFGVADRILFVRGSVVTVVRSIQDLNPMLTFVDGDHSESGVERDLAALESQIPVGGLVLLHDYADPRNADPAAADMGVPAGVARSWMPRDCDFAGVFGCCGLFVRRQGGPPQEPDHRLPPLLDLLWRDTARMQYLQRVRWPLGRAFRRGRGAIARTRPRVIRGSPSP